MAAKKKDLEIIYNLQWKCKPVNGVDKTSVIGVYDIPATTLNWELFKTYLLKNSGTTGDDVIISYCIDNGKEYAIQSQTDFQVALYAFRNKARNGEIINLKLDRISDQKVANRHSNDVETQFDNQDSMVSVCCGAFDSPPEWFLNYMVQFKKEINEEVTATVSSVLSTALADVNKPQAPAVNVPAPSVVLDCPRTMPELKRLKKLQPTLTVPAPSTETSHKELTKSYKLDRKVEKMERKLAKYKEKHLTLCQLSKFNENDGVMTGKIKRHEHKKDKEHKSKKYQEKEKPTESLKGSESRNRREEEKPTQFLKGREMKISQDENPTQFFNKREMKIFQETEKPMPLRKESEIVKDMKKRAALMAEPASVAETEWEGKMDAAPVNTKPIVPHMLGGEVYLHQWEVKNTGTAPWTSQTFLQFTWGSKALVPLDDIISVPYLKPGEIGTIAVRIQIPNESGKYEAYWHFMHKGRRFGHWLGCPIVVDPFDLKGHESVLKHSMYRQISDPSPRITETRVQSPPKPYSHYLRYDDTMYQFPSDYYNPRPGPTEILSEYALAQAKNEQDVDCAKVLHESLIQALQTKNEKQSQQENSSSDSDNQSIASLSGSSVSSKGSQDEYVVVPVPDCFLLDKSIESVKIPDEILTPQPSSSSNEVAKPATPFEEVPQPNEVPTSTKSSEEVLKPNTSSVEVLQPSTSSESHQNEENCDNNNNDNVSVKSCSSEYNPEDLRDTVLISVPKDVNGGFAYVYVDGQKVPIPKCLLKSEYLQKGTSRPSNTPKTPSTIEHLSAIQSPVMSEIEAEADLTSVPSEIFEPKAYVTHATAPKEEEPYMSDASYYHSHCSAAASSFSDANTVFQENMDDHSRLFIFPEKRPGYEVVTPATTQTLPEAVEAIKLNADVPTNRESSAGSAVHILPENLVNGAVSVASSALNTARTVFNMIAPTREVQGYWVDGNWVRDEQVTPRLANLQALCDMGFYDVQLNTTLLDRHRDDLQTVIDELVQRIV